MNSNIAFRGSILALAVASSLASSRLAYADCTSDSECQKGFTCQVTGGTACASAGCATGPGAAPCADPPPPPNCVPQTFSSCEPGPCKTDSDCGDGMVCHSTAVDNCATIACAPGEKCVEPPVTCTTTTTSTCTYKFQLPCKVDSDCGDGFTCEPDTSFECYGAGVGGGAVDAGAGTTVSPSVVNGATASGGGTVSAGATGSPLTGIGATPAPAVDAGAVEPAPGPVPPSTCTTTTLPTSSCVAKSITCTRDADCPATWTCLAPPPAPAPLIACPAIAQVDGGKPVDCPQPSPAPMSLPSQCVPPAPTVGQGSTFSGGSASGTTADQGAVGYGDAGVTGSPTSPASPSVGGRGTAGSSGSSSGSTASPVQSNGLPPTSGSPAAASHASGSSNDGDASMDGCQMGPGSAAPSGSSLLAWLGVGAFLVRRRRSA